jgi:two-component system CheB/CheR fusion protein
MAAKRSRAKRAEKKPQRSALVKEVAGKPARRKAATQPSPVPIEPPPFFNDTGSRAFIVGIGASAGGLEALNTFFDAMPIDSGIGFVVVTHQHPGHTSLLPELLSRRTRMPVESARDHTVVEPDHVYVCPPGSNLAILNGALQLMEPEVGPDLRLSIDYFFRSLGRDQGDRAICIVLSGTGSDGTLGLRAVKEHSGMAVVQDEHSAHFAGMPQSAAATRLADYVLSPDQMPARLIAYVQSARVLSPTVDAADAELADTLPKIFVLLRNRLGHDFSGYKQKTMHRRIERRMRIHQIARAHDYVQLLQAQPHELDLLFQELLISVTQFFRDAQAFEALASQFAQRIDSQASLRIWVPGCATGEEPYSIAILATELAERTGKRLHLQVFATDIDPNSIEVARLGLYPMGIAADVGAQRLQRFFTAETHGYRIRKQIRDRIVFATHDVLRDPPFTKVDLLSCRNLLIYLNAQLQHRLFPLFHYALRPGGLLWLGTSETAASHAELFDTVDRKWKIYERRKVLPGTLPLLNLRRSATVAIPPRERPSSPPTFSVVDTMEDALLERFAPPTLVVSDRGEIVCIHGRTGKYLEPSAGEPRNNVFAMARQGLRMSLQAAMRSAAAEDREVVYRGIAVETHDEPERVDLIVGRLTEPEAVRGLLRVSFVTASSAPPAQAVSKKAKGARPQLQVETELRHTRDSLQATIDELQTSNEELKSTNEELQSTNEELQSTNEELETSKEEMQSLNEELHTVNSELQMKIEELAAVNDDMQNLLNGTDIATLFLDRDLKIKRFTEPARRVVRLIASDVGRSISDLASQVHYETLVDDAKHVLSTLTPHETEAQTLDGQWLLVRMLPYRTAQNAIDGIVITFVDIDRVKRAESLAASRAFAENIVQTVREPLVVLDASLCILSGNRAFSRLLGLDQPELEGRSLFDVGGLRFALPTLRARLDSVVSQGHSIEDFELSLDVPQVGLRGFQLNARRLEELGAIAARVLVVLHETHTGQTVQTS